MIDTNILLDWLLDRDPIRTAQIDKLLGRIKEAYVPDIVLAETAFALEKTYGLPRETVADNLIKILGEKVFACNRIVLTPAIATYQERPSLSFVDCYLLEYAEMRDDLPLWTFDKKLVNQGSGRAKLLS